MIFETILANGTRVLFRPIRPTDKELIRRGFDQLSPESRYRRFFHSIDHLSNKQLAYLTEVDGRDHFAWVAVAPDDPEHRGVGVSRWVRLPDEPEVAEAAVTVIDDFQGLGLGKALLQLASRSAVEQGVKALRAWILAENGPAIEMMEGLGARPGRIEGGLREVTVPLPDDPNEVHLGPAPLVLREVASGGLRGSTDPDRPDRVHLA